MSDKRIHAATLLTEFRKSSTKAGNTLVDLLFETDPDLINGGVSTDYVEAVEVGDTPRSHPVILGVVTQPAGIDRQTTCLIGAYLFVTELLGGSAAGLFGHTEIQAQLTQPLSVIKPVSGAYVDAELVELAPFAPLADVMEITHEGSDRWVYMS